MAKKPFKATIFDIDGILISTEGLQFQAWAKALKELYGLNFLPETYKKKRMVGNTHEYIADKIAKLFSQVKVDELLPLRKNIIDGLVLTVDYETMPYAKESINYFGNVIHTPIGFSTGAVSEESQIKLERTGIDKLVEIYDIPVIGKDMLGEGRGKPAPDSYLVTADRLGLKADKLILTFEDTLAGVESALAAGTTCFVIPNEWTRDFDFPKEAIRFNCLKDTIDYIDENYIFQPSLE